MPFVKKILIDLEKLKNRYVGLGEVSYRFAKALQPHAKQLREKGIHIYLLVPFSYKNHFGEDFHYITANFLRNKLPFLLPDFDVWHALHQTSGYMPYYSKTKYLLTIHDLNFIHEKIAPKIIKYKQRLQRKINKAAVLTTISEFTRKEILQYLKADHLPLITIHNGVGNPLDIPPSRPPAMASIASPYLFHISRISPKKNTHTLVDMMKLLPEKKLVIAGTWDTKYAKQLADRIRNEQIDNVIIISMPDESEKTWLYLHCEAFLFPSLFEGFGLPVIEAMYCGKPVFTSTHSSLPEIGADKAFYWENFDPSYMKKVLIRGLEEHYRDGSRAEETRSYAASFSWDEVIFQYIKLYEKLLAAPSPAFGKDSFSV